MTILNGLRKKNLTVKIAATSVAITALVAVILGGVFFEQYKRHVYGDFTKRGSLLAKVAAHVGAGAVLNANGEDVQPLISGITGEKDVEYVVVEDVRGVVLAQTDTGLEGLAPAAANATNAGHAAGYENVKIKVWTPAGRAEIYEFSAPVHSQTTGSVGYGRDRGAGVVRVGITTASARDAVIRGARLLFALTAVLVALSVLATIRTAKTVLKPLRSLLSCVQFTGDGDRTHNIAVTETNDEIGELGKAFGRMQEDLNNMVRQIKSSAELVDASVSELSMSSINSRSGWC